MVKRSVRRVAGNSKVQQGVLVTLSGFVAGLIIVLANGSVPFPSEMAWLGVPTLMGLQALSRVLPADGSEASAAPPPRRPGRRVKASGVTWDTTREG